MSHDTTRLNPKTETVRPILHHDLFPSHVSKETIGLLEKCKIKYVKLEEWIPMNSDRLFYMEKFETTAK